MWAGLCVLIGPVRPSGVRGFGYWGCLLPGVSVETNSGESQCVTAY